MQPIKTASTLERIIRNSIFTAMVLVFGVWSFYDGYVGYPAKNLAMAKSELPPEHQDEAFISPQVLEENTKFIKRGMNLKNIEDRLGPPSYQGEEEGRKSKAVWFGPGGTLIVRYTGPGVVLKGEWRKGQKKETDLILQKAMGAVLTPIGLFMLLRVLLMTFRGGSLTDAGLKPAGKPLIPFEAMKGWDTSNYKKRGHIGLTYEIDGQEVSYLLDDYKLSAFAEIVREICLRCDFENPIRDETDAAHSPTPRLTEAEASCSEGAEDRPQA